MKVSNFRKAGIIGALGTVAAGGVSAVQNNQAHKRADERAAEEQQRLMRSGGMEKKVLIVCLNLMK